MNTGLFKTVLKVSILVFIFGFLFGGLFMKLVITDKLLQTVFALIGAMSVGATVGVFFLAMCQASKDPDNEQG